MRARQRQMPSGPRVRRVNTRLMEADIGFIDDGALPVIDPYVRTLRRYFSQLPGQSVEFQSGGRLFGGFWMNLSKSRRKSIRLNGEPPALLDYSNMFANLLYAEIGEFPPEGDLYDSQDTSMGIAWRSTGKASSWPSMPCSSERPKSYHPRSSHGSPMVPQWECSEGRCQPVTPISSRL